MEAVPTKFVPGGVVRTIPRGEPFSGLANMAARPKDRIKSKRLIVPEC